jgi:hypothetical protein
LPLPEGIQHDERQAGDDRHGRRAKGNGFPAIFNIEADPHEEVNILGTSACVVGGILKVIGEYIKTLEKYPNPKVNMMEFGKPTR